MVAIVEVIAIEEMIAAAGETIVATVVATDVMIVAIAIDVGIVMTVAAIVTEEMIEKDLDRVVIRFFSFFNIADLKIRFWDL